MGWCALGNEPLAKGLTSSARNDNGTFVKGHQSPGPGNPINAKVQKLRQALIESVGTEDMQEIIKALITNAKAGDVQATKELFDRVLGKPMQAIEMSGPEGGPVRTHSLDFALLTVTELETLRTLHLKAIKSE
jgi:hypothetical protein